MNHRHKLMASMLLLLAALPGSAVAGYSGWLETYVGMKPDPDRPGAMVYRKDGVSLGAYDKILLAPVEIMYHPESEDKSIEPGELKTIADGLRDQIVAALEPDYPVVSRPGEGVLVVRMAITGLKLGQKKRGLLGYTPIGLVVTTGMSAAGMRVSMKEASLEAELYDGKSGERLGALMDNAPAGEEEDLTWDDLKATLDFYAKRFRARLDAEHGK